MSIIVEKTITETFLRRVRTTPNAVGFQFKPSYVELGAVGEWKQLTFKEIYFTCRFIAYGLIHLGVKKGDRVALLSGTRVEWSLCDMAILGAQGVTVPIYSSSASGDVSYILNHSEARILIVEDSSQLQKVLTEKENHPDLFPNLAKIIVIEPSSMALAARSPAQAKNILTLQALRELGKRAEAKSPELFDQNLISAQPEDLITICYTSGTTGIPKGVMLTHDNLISVVEDCATVLSKIIDPKDEVILSYLPFSHIFGKLESFLVYPFGWKQGFGESVDVLMANMKEIQPTVIFAVPRVFEKAYDRILNSVETGPRIQKEIFYHALVIAKRYHAAVWEGKGPSLLDSLQYQVAKATLFRKVLQVFGGRLKFVVCGGAPLPKCVGQFFQYLGLQILEGYGLTETSAPVCVNTPEKIRFGSVGRPLPEVTLKLAEDGEILIKSRKVFQGYYKMPALSREALKEGWLYTGDIGRIDSDGFLWITDRKKDLIITSGGKNIAPQKIENLARTQKFIHQFVVCGDRRSYLTALVTLDQDQVIQFANEQAILFSDYSELIKHPRIISLAQKSINAVNKQLSSFETIKKFLILPTDFTVQNGELTPSLKVKRNVISKRYESELDSLYLDNGPRAFA